MKSERDLLCFGKTEWIETSAPESVTAFRRILDEEEIIFVGNTKNINVVVDIKGLSDNKKCILCNGENKIADCILHLGPYEYVVFE